MNYIKYLTQLPKLIIDAFIELNYKICGDNIKEYLQLNNGISDDTLIRKDLDTCNSIFIIKLPLRDKLEIITSLLILITMVTI